VAQLARHRTHLARRRPPDRKRRQQADRYAKRKGDGVVAGNVVQQPRDPRAGRATGKSGEHEKFEAAKREPEEMPELDIEF